MRRRGSASREDCGSKNMISCSLLWKGSPLCGHEGMLMTGTEGGLEEHLGHQVNVPVLKYLHICDLRRRDEKGQRLEAERPSRRL